MRCTHLLIAPALLAIAVAACSAERPVTTPATTSSPTPATGPGPTARAPDVGVTMRYACESNHNVDVHGERSVTVTTADGTTDLPRVADSSPPQFADDTLSFSINTKGAELGHAGVGSFACRPE